MINVITLKNSGLEQQQTDRITWIICMSSKHLLVWRFYIFIAYLQLSSYLYSIPVCLTCLFVSWCWLKQKVTEESFLLFIIHYFGFEKL